MDFDGLLQRFTKRDDIKYEDLTPAERDTFQRYLGDLEKSVITLASVRDYISQMKQQVEQELTKVGLDDETDTFLKARLRNYMLLEAFLSTPEKARQALEKALGNL